jgi:carboxylate-amine ligase
MVALIQALVVKIKKENPYPDIHTQILQSNKWQAARYGLEGVFVDPTTIQKLTMREAIENLCDLVEPTLISLGKGKYIKIIEKIFKKGTRSNKQRELYSTSNNFKHMIRSLKEQFYQ